MTNQTTQTIAQATMPLVSFIITTYNIPIEYLRACLQSIFALSLAAGEREIIIIDDGSEQSPLKELEAFRDEFIYVRQTNQGVAVARNKGLSLAQGQYIQFIDGDDYLLTTPYEQGLDIARFQHPDVVLFRFTTSGRAERAFAYKGPVTGSHYMKTHNLHATVCGYLFHRSILGNLRFTPGTVYGEDEEFTPQLILRAERLFSTESQAYYYRQHSESVLHRHAPEARQQRLSDNLRVLKHLRHLADTLPLVDREALQRRVAQMTMDYIYNSMIFSKNASGVEQQIETLQKAGLFPLPERKYTRKYILFRKLTRTAGKRKVMKAVLSVIS